MASSSKTEEKKLKMIIEEFWKKPNDNVLKQLLPKGKVRAGINLSNSLLVTGRDNDGNPEGVSPDLAMAVAKALNAPCELISYKTPGDVADAINRQEWDIGLIGAEPQREEFINFSPAYSQIEAVFCVSNSSSIYSNSDIDHRGNVIVTTARAAFTLWLERHIRHAKIISMDTLDNATEAFRAGHANILASLRTKIEDDNIVKSKIIEPAFMTVQQAIGCGKEYSEAHAWLCDFVVSACKAGFVKQRIEFHKVKGLMSAEY